MDTSGDRPFVACGACRLEWPSWDTFVADPGVRLLGLQAILSRPDANLLVFEHRCGSSVSVLSSRVRHLVPSARGTPHVSLRGTDRCPGHCLSLVDHDLCDEPCANAVDRRMIRIVEDLQRGRDTGRSRARRA
jgi:hypothetical protein